MSLHNYPSISNVKARTNFHINKQSLLITLVLTINIGDNESSKYWLSILNELKNRGVKDILIICADRLSGIKEAIATDLKTIYHAANEEKARETLNGVNEKWTPKYPNSMKRWYDNRNAISPIFKFSPAVRKVIYTTNAIERLNSTYRKLTRQRSVFPSDTVLLKALYLATFEATKNGHRQSETGVLYMESCASCTKSGCQNKTISYRKKTMPAPAGALDMGEI